MTLVAKRKEIDPSFGRRLRELREKVALTQSDLGDLAGMLGNAIARLEAGGREPGWGTVKKLAEALGVSPNDFLENSKPDRQVDDVSRHESSTRPISKRK